METKRWAANVAALVAVTATIAGFAAWIHADNAAHDNAAINVYRRASRLPLLDAPVNHTPAVALFVLAGVALVAALVLFAWGRSAQTPST
jgi:hypothetical protein